MPYLRGHVFGFPTNKEVFGWKRNTRSIFAVKLKRGRREKWENFTRWTSMESSVIAAAKALSLLSRLVLLFISPKTIFVFYFKIFLIFNIFFSIAFSSVNS